MSQGALSVRVEADFSPLLNGFKQVERQAQTSGQAIGRGLDDGIDQASNSLAALQQELNRQAFAQRLRVLGRVLLLLLFCHKQQHREPKSWLRGSTSAFGFP
jgi:hypothetical protein